MNFNYILFVSVFVGIVALIFISIKYNKKIHKITVNPIDIMLIAFFFIALWLSDLMSLRMAESGWYVPTGVVSTVTVPAIFVYVITTGTMFIIAYYYKNETLRTTKNKTYRKVNRFFSNVMIIGLYWFLLSSLLMAYKGFNFVLFGQETIGLYHFSLPFIIIPAIFLAVDLN